MIAEKRDTLIYSFYWAWHSAHRGSVGSVKHLERFVGGGWLTQSDVAAAGCGCKQIDLGAIARPPNTSKRPVFAQKQLCAAADLNVIVCDAQGGVCTVYVSPCMTLWF